MDQPQYWFVRSSGRYQAAAVLSCNLSNVQSALRANVNVSDIPRGQVVARWCRALGVLPSKTGLACRKALRRHSGMARSIRSETQEHARRLGSCLSGSHMARRAIFGRRLFLHRLGRFGECRVHSPDTETFSHRAETQLCQKNPCPNGRGLQTAHKSRPPRHRVALPPWYLAPHPARASGPSASSPR
jgi:hypothetical protein